MTGLPADAGTVLLPIARNAIARELGLGGPEPDTSAPWLAEPGACFVTLTQARRLRGCMGSLEPRRRLVLDVRENAVAAAVFDRRFPPMRPEELARTRIEVSVLSAQRPLVFTDREDALAQLRPGVDGVVLTRGTARATYLPQVWAQLPDPGQFIAALAHKAGLGPWATMGRWPPDLELSTYTVTAWEEPEPEET